MTHSIQEQEALATSLLENKQGAKATKILQALIALKPANMDWLYYQLGLAYRIDKKWAKAANAFMQTLKLNPQLAIAAIAFGDVSVEMKAYIEAEKAYLHALQFKSVHTELAQSYLRLGTILIKNKQYEFALQAYKNALDLDKNLCTQLVEIYATLHKTFNQENKVELAQKVLERTKVIEEEIQSTSSTVEKVNDNELLLSQLYQVQEELEVYFLRNQELQKENLEKQQQLEQLTQTNTDQQQQITQLETINSDKQQQIVQLEKIYADKQQKIEQLEKAHADQQQKIEQLEKTYADKQQQIKQSEKVSENKQRLEQLEKEGVYKQQKIAQLEKNYTDQQQQLHLLEKVNTDQSQAIQRLEEDLADFSLSESRWHEAATLWNKIIFDNPQHPKAYYKRAYAQAALNNQTSIHSDDNYHKVTEMALSLPSFDTETMQPQVKYVVCSTGRSGSFLLCRQLFNSQLGIPQEYFNPNHQELISSRLGIPSANNHDYLAFLLSHRTTANHVWGMKLHWHQYQNKQLFIDNHLLDSDVKYIFLYRDDLVAQAISYHLSFVTGCWGFDETQTSVPHKVDFYDLAHIEKCYQRLIEGNEGWKTFFKQKNIEPLRIKYEDFIQNQPHHMRKIVDFLGVDQSNYTPCVAEPKEQTNSAYFNLKRQSLIDQFMLRLKK
ncbi:Stf0 family sulfotransferase [Candidatus Albibeggiatoa sp. nov. NOAA]|uniref:Stf0 family sulfotransferase n=1 Tax=Candidatus Albibeggiatoa sp. nov. NOAA TaxID=3162724 RepID=UPI0032FA869F|nr:Stf0 family sulfotransferase [Thiotrichaceae bacterium]